jgi:thioester reductase-like protein
MFGLDVTHHDQLARSVDTIYHAGADVNWVQPYVALRHTNVIGTTALLRFACTCRPKPFHFVSSLSVCYATDGPPVVDEDAEMLPHVARLPLGYAQSKCVAEVLVRQAAARGLPTHIYRPALIAGAAHTGASNVDDLIAALLKGCIQMGAAPDLDWTFDAVPVDYTARAIASVVGNAEHTSTIIHIRHPRPRHWRECVLWANVLGYRMTLQPFPTWQDQLTRQATCSGHALYALRPFLLRETARHRTVAELYEERTRSQAVDTKSRVALQAAGLECPTLDADLLDRYFQDYVARGFLPDRRNSRCTVRRTAPQLDELQPLMRIHFGDARLIVCEARLVQAGSDRSVIGELTSWRRGRRTGLFRYDLEIERGGRRSSLDVMVKVKAADEDILDVAETVAGMCDDRLASELRRFRGSIGIRGSHVRELAIYEQDDDRLRRHLPTCYGTWRHDREASWGVVIEWLADMLLIDASDDTISWTTPHVAAAIDGLAALHSVWLGRERELCAQSWIGHVATAESAGRMTPLWMALADHAAPRVCEWAGPDLVRAHRRLAETAAEWWPGLDALPRTLIHNDFNSRNIALRRTPAGPRLVAYDWELAALGAPQRDLAELLCFVLPEDASLDTLNAWVERHRTRLEVESGIALPRGRWRAGFVSALAEFLVCRLSFYALIDRATPQPFLPRVVRTWERLYEAAASWRDGQ